MEIQNPLSIYCNLRPDQRSNELRSQCITMLRNIEFFLNLENKGLNLNLILDSSRVISYKQSTKIMALDTTITMIEGKATVFEKLIFRKKKKFEKRSISPVKKKRKNNFFITESENQKLEENDENLNSEFSISEDLKQRLKEEGKGVELFYHMKDPEIFNLRTHELKIKFSKDLQPGDSHDFFYYHLKPREPKKIKKKKIVKKKKKKRRLVKACTLDVFDENNFKVFGGLMMTKKKKRLITKGILALANKEILIAKTDCLVLMTKKHAILDFLYYKKQKKIEYRVSQVLDFFESISRDRLKGIVKRFKLIKKKRKQKIFSKGDKSSSFFLILHGEIEVSIHY